MDGLGRRIDPTAYPAARPGKFVGVFYFLWMQGGPKDRVFDISKLLAASPAAPAWGPRGAFHWWGEPFLGYYRSDDTYVIARHAQQLSDAGVDVIVFDVTNALTYDATLLKVFDTFERLRAQGRRTPQIAFITHGKSAATINHLYDTIYAPGLHSDLWFRWRGKPLMMGPSAGLDAKVASFFTMRDSWAWTSPNGWFKDGHNKWPWLDHTPQKFGWTDAPNRPEQISIAAAEHPVTRIGRSFHDGHQPPRAEATPARGLYFAEQWKRALQVDPEFVFVTGWNEWIAQRFIAKPTGTPKVLGYKLLSTGDTFFVDTYSEEFSRDIEPMRGGHGDAFYYQMVEGIRRFKGVRPLPPTSRPRSIDVDGAFDQWAGVTPKYMDDLHDTDPRNAQGYGDAGTLKNDSGRNDIDTAQVTYDDKNVYFYVRTRENLTRPSDSGWMTLLVRTAGRGWGGYDLAINRTAPHDGRATVERVTDGKRWPSAGEARLRFAGKELQLSVPRSLLGGTGGRLQRFEFKWTDNVPAGGDPIAFIDQGDVAPNGRFN
ncbi:MAG: hypothetical protein ACTHLZ_02325, partial [Tepidisphaeraceae bacterium]